MSNRPVRLSRVWAPWIPVVVIVDALVVFLSGWAALWARWLFFDASGSELVPDIWWDALLGTSLAFPLTMQLLGFYRPVVEPFASPRLWRRIMAWGVQVSLLLLLLFAIKSGHQFSRLWIAIWFMMGLIFFALEVRLFAHIQVWRSRAGIGVRDVLLIGGGTLAHRAASLITAHPSCGLRVGGYLAESVESPGMSDFECLGMIEDVEAVVASNQFDEVWIALPLSQQQRIQTLLRSMREHLIDVRLIPDIFAFDLVNREVEEVLGLPVIGLVTNPQRGVDHLMKRLMDILGALVGLIFFSPILLFCALGIYFTMGRPIFFLQDRHGLDGRSFKIFKFRTMCLHDKGGKYQQAIKGDRRVTPFGAFLRRRSLDELPQLFNVLIGDMSLVGPRPHPVDMNHENWAEIDRYALRHRVKPGITGWAQVNGLRGDAGEKDLLRRRVEFDLAYIDNWSIFLDIKILFKTLLIAWNQPSAY